VGDATQLDSRRVRRIFERMEREACRKLGKWFAGAIRVQHSAEMRYGEQIFEVDVPLDDVDWQSEQLLDSMVERFHRRHAELYTYSVPDQEVVLVNARVAAVGVLPAIPEERAASCAGDAGVTRRRRIHLERWREVPVFDMDRLVAGQEIAGPAIVEAETTTVLLNMGDRARINDLGWLDISLRAVRRA
jgi:N-methylhydantoinase A